MRSNLQNTMPDNMEQLDDNLSKIENALKDTMKMCIEELKNGSVKEKDLIQLWANHINTIGSFLFEECERTGNKTFYKDIVKYMIFSR